MPAGFNAVEAAYKATQDRSTLAALTPEQRAQVAKVREMDIIAHARKVAPVRERAFVSTGRVRRIRFS